MKVVVDKLPETCRDCLFYGDTRWADGCRLLNIGLSVGESERCVHRSCPLVSIKDIFKEEKKGN